MIRHAMTRLIQWKSENTNKPVILRGSRQVGKTWIVKEFAKDHYENIAYVNCEGNKRMDLLFESNPDFVRFRTAIQIETGVNIDKGETVIILDNINCIENAEEIIEEFYSIEYPMIAITTNMLCSQSSRCENVLMYPVSFEEYLETRGFKDLAELIGSRDWELKSVFSSKYIELMQEYMYVGGMPECVNAFIETGDFSKVRRIQKRILTEYELGFFRMVSGKSVSKMRLAYESVPSQIIKENNKFVYDTVKKGARAKEFDSVLKALEQRGMIGKVGRITKPSLALMAYPGNTFKVYINDIGLLGARLGIEHNHYFKETIFSSHYCALSQQFVWQQMICHEVSPKYWSAYKGTSRIDFVILCGDDIIPIEIVGMENRKAKNLRVYIDKFSPKRAIRMSLCDYKNEDGFINVPLYAAGAIMDVCSGDIIQR